MTSCRATTASPRRRRRRIDRDGWLHSGDMGVMRADGHLRFMGRYKDMLKIGGENVDPMEVEAFLMSLAGVNLAAVVELPDARLSEVGVAFVQTRARPRAHRRARCSRTARAGSRASRSRATSSSSTTSR